MGRCSSILVDSVQPQDLPVLRELFLAARKAAFNWMPPSSFQSQDFDRETKGETILVATKEKQLIGFISIWMPDNFIHHLYISPVHQRTGAGSALLRSALRILDGKASLKCMVQNLNAIQFYQAKGFVANGRGNTADGEYIIFKYDETHNHD
jgi:ribosomal protein S18 acetylase RimI-like enzyme